MLMLADRRSERMRWLLRAASVPAVSAEAAIIRKQQSAVRAPAPPEAGLDTPPQGPSVLNALVHAAS
jgi:hypothetical protein